MNVSPFIEHVIDNSDLLAMIIRADINCEGVNFFTKEDLSQQIAYMSHPKGKLIEPHIHKPVLRNVEYTSEVLYIRKGELKVDFYNNYKEFLLSKTLRAGDLILLISGGHGFEVLEPIEMFEIKQGPFAGENDKERFNPSANHRVINK